MISIIITLIILSLLYYVISYQQEKNTSKTIEAEILLVGSNYLLVSVDDETEYLIHTNELSYNIGDTIKLEIENIDLTKSPYEATASSISLIRTSPIENENQEEENTPDTEETINNNQENTTNTSESNSVNEENVIKYFETLDNELDNYDTSDETLGSKIKSKFVNCIDFIFYNKEINGITFNELTNKTKLKILEITLSIDSKLDEKFPGYKDSISSTYQNIKNKVIEKYLEITTNICNKEENLCTTAKENFQTLKDNFGITWSLIKELIGTSTTKLKDWYEIWRYN